MCNVVELLEKMKNTYFFPKLGVFSDFLWTEAQQSCDGGGGVAQCPVLRANEPKRRVRDAHQKSACINFCFIIYIFVRNGFEFIIYIHGLLSNLMPVNTSPVKLIILQRGSFSRYSPPSPPSLTMCSRQSAGWQSRNDRHLSPLAVCLHFSK